MKETLLALFAGSVIVLGACGGGDNGDSTGNNSDATENVVAKETYSQSCASCHGQNLEGGVGLDLTKVGSRLDASEIENIILHGQGIMRGGLLQGEDAKAVAEWLSTKK